MLTGVSAGLSSRSAFSRTSERYPKLAKAFVAADGDPGVTRTRNISLRRRMLYPVELRDRLFLIAVRKMVRNAYLPA